jgi:hypothetical protein
VTTGAAAGRRSFTVHADPAIDAVVERHLGLIRDTLLAADDRIQALVLVGGFGRGEGTVIRDGGGFRPYNDYDLVVIHPRPGECGPVVASLPRLARQLGLGHVDAEIMSAGELARASPSMHVHDMVHGGHVFHGDPAILSSVPARSAAGDQVGVGPASQLLLNRLTCLLECVRGEHFAAPPRTAEERFGIAYFAGKVLLSVAAAMLAERRAHATSYVERARRFRRAFPHDPDLCRAVDEATAFKLDPPREPPGGAETVALWFAVRDRYLEALLRFAGLAAGRAFDRWEEYERWRRAGRWLDELRKARWWLFDRRRRDDIIGWNRLTDVQLACACLTRAVRPDGSFDAELTDRARGFLSPHTPHAMEGWEETRAECVRCDYAFVHPIPATDSGEAHGRAEG